MMHPFHWSIQLYRLVVTLYGGCLSGVEMKPAALAILRQRASAAGLINVRTFVGMIENFEEPFDVGLAL